MHENLGIYWKDTQNVIFFFFFLEIVRFEQILPVLDKLELSSLSTF